MAASPSGTIVLAGSGGTITDSHGNHWTISASDSVLINGLLANFTSNVAELVYLSGVVWHENTSSQWYQWTGGGWVAGTDPIPAENTAQKLQQIADTQQTIISDLSALSAATQQDFAITNVNQNEILQQLGTQQTIVSNIEIAISTNQQVVAADFVSCLQNLNQIIADVQVLFGIVAENQMLINKIITILTAFKITAADPTFTKQEPPTRPGP